MDRELDHAYAYCRSITRERAKNFYYAFITLPTAKRKAIYAAYAFCRLCDDAVDEVTDVDEKLRLLAEQREGLASTYAGAPEGRVFVALQDVISAYNIPREYLEEVINGVEMDISKARYPTFEELREYCYRVASAVGLICIEIFGYNDPSAREHAVELGLAMQLTNIRRDVEEDVARDRVYIPQEDLERFGCSEEDIFRGRVTDNFRDLMRFQVGRARERFRACPAMLHNTYSRLLDRIEASGYRVFGNRIGLSAGGKLAMVARLWVNGIAARAAGK